MTKKTNKTNKPSNEALLVACKQRGYQMKRQGRLLSAIGDLIVEHWRKYEDVRPFGMDELKAGLPFIQSRVPRATFDETVELLRSEQTLFALALRCEPTVA